MTLQQCLAALKAVVNSRCNFCSVLQASNDPELVHRVVLHISDYIVVVGPLRRTSGVSTGQQVVGELPRMFRLWCSSLISMTYMRRKGLRWSACSPPGLNVGLTLILPAQLPRRRLQSILIFLRRVRRPPPPSRTDSTHARSSYGCHAPLAVTLRKRPMEAGFVHLFQSPSSPIGTAIQKPKKLQPDDVRLPAQLSPIAGTKTTESVRTRPTLETLRC